MKFNCFFITSTSLVHTLSVYEMWMPVECGISEDWCGEGRGGCGCGGGGVVVHTIQPELKS